MMKKPDFLIIGAMKCGTTSLCGEAPQSLKEQGIQYRKKMKAEREWPKISLDIF